MIREMYYEESAVPVNARKEEKLNKGFTIAAIVFFVLFWKSFNTCPKSKKEKKAHK